MDSFDENNYNSQEEDNLMQNNSDVVTTPSIKIDFSIYLKRAANKVVPSLLIYQKLNVYDIDYDRLEPGKLLNDKVIDFFVEFMMELKKYCNKKLQIQNNNSATILCSYVFSSLDLYKYNRDIFDLDQPQKYLRVNNQRSVLECHDRVFLVVNEADYHWILIEISLSQDQQLSDCEDIIQKRGLQKDMVLPKNEKGNTQISIKNSTSINHSKKNTKNKINKQTNIISQRKQLQNESLSHGDIKLNNLNINPPNKNNVQQQDPSCFDLQNKRNESECKNKVIRKITMRVYNSLGQRSNVENQTAVVLLQKYFTHDFKQLYGKDSIIQFEVISEKAPTQTGLDCGVFCCKYLQKLYFEENRVFEQGQFTPTKMNEYRRFIQQLMMDLKISSNQDYAAVYEKYINLNI